MKGPIPFEVAREHATDMVFKNVTLAWPWLKKPDTKYKEDGEFRVEMVLTPEEAEPYAAQLQEVLDGWVKAGGAHTKSKKVMGFSMKELDDGTVSFKAAMRATKTRDGQTIQQRPRIVDAKKQPVTANIGGGTKANVAVSLWPWFTAALGYGIRITLKAVQVLELQEFTAASDNAFDEEDGYEATASVSTEGAAEDGDF